MPQIIPMGIQISEFKKMTMKEFYALQEGMKLNAKLNDENSWVQGTYTLKAFIEVMKAFASGMNGKTYKIDYPKRPYMQMEDFSQKDLEKEIEHDIAIMQMWTTQLGQQGLNKSPY